MLYRLGRQPEGKRCLVKLRTTGDNVINAAERARPVKRALRPLQYLDAIDVDEPQVGIGRVKGNAGIVYLDGYGRLALSVEGAVGNSTNELATVISENRARPAPIGPAGMSKDKSPYGHAPPRREGLLQREAAALRRMRSPSSRIRAPMSVARSSTSFDPSPMTNIPEKCVFSSDGSTSTRLFE